METEMERKKTDTRWRILLRMIAIVTAGMLCACLGSPSSTTTADSEEERNLPSIVEPIVSYEGGQVDVQDEIADEPEEPTEGDTEIEPMEVHFIDVGEGDSTLIRCGSGAMLIDAGDPSMGTTVRGYLKKQGVDRLDYLILTHSDKDHIGGAASVVSNVEIGEIFMCSYEKYNDVYNNLINEMFYKSMTWSTPKVGEVLSLGDAEVTVVAPNRVYDNPNDSSIAVLIRHGNDSFLFTGDAEGPAEADMIANGLDLDATVYKVGHHGSRTSTSQDFLDAVDPEYAVISCAKDNEYGHPHIETMEKLSARGVILYRTDVQGSIVAYSNGDGVEFDSEPADDWSPGSSPNDESASEQVNRALPTVSVEVTYVANTNTKKFHLPTCSSVTDMKAKNRWDTTLTREELMNQGYKPCQRCKP